IGAQITETILITKKRKFQKQAFEINKNEQLSDEQKKEQIKAAKEIYKDSISKENLKKKIYEVLAFIGIKNIDSRINAYPHEFSGGMRQRIVIAMSIVSEPDLIIADEPTTALDVTIQAKVLDLIKKLRNEFNITIIFISHNIALIANFCDYIYVMYAGKIVEQGLIKEIFTKPRHPYTWGLICSIP
ncbi:MAG: ATP-binding cassette domain-containing protein, partial [Clostridium sp.]